MLSLKVIAEPIDYIDANTNQIIIILITPAHCRLFKVFLNNNGVSVQIILLIRVNDRTER